MIDFIAFARAHGILIDRLPPIGVWRRYPTEDHQRKRNGAVKFMGTHGFVQNWATNTEVEVWRGDDTVNVDVAKLRRDAQQAERKRIEQQEAAAKKAGWIMHQCQNAYHPYLEAKGFKEEQGNVWKTEDGLVLVIPMRVGHRLVGCQLIREDGEKKFLFGQRTSEASFVFDNKGPHILCEGYATGLSIRAAMKALKRRYTLHICFSAGNMVKVAATLPRGFVVADNDESRAGEEAAKRIGWPYWMPPDVGHDFNDYMQDVKLFKASQSLVKSLPIL
jgi:putative DNA primase/helicase